MIADPHYPRIVLSFIYRGYRIQIAQDTFDDYPVFSAWVDHPWGSAIATPCELVWAIAVRKGKQ
ncbi:MAG: hypothetical protein VKJ64_02150 [Leptolyngbyaceae bacterium]|nr:hypothetical protein [Leptolyngbyaceae bacterium]